LSHIQSTDILHEDGKLLREIFESLGALRSFLLKQEVRSILRDEYKSRFPNKKVERAFFKRTIGAGLIIEEGVKTGKTIKLSHVLRALSESLDCTDETSQTDFFERKNATIPEKLIASQNKMVTPVKSERALLPVQRDDEVGNLVTANLYVHGYGSGTSKKQIRNLFSQYTDVVGVSVKNGYSYVRTLDREGAIFARQKLNGTQWNGGTLTIRFAKEFK